MENGDPITNHELLMSSSTSSYYKNESKVSRDEVVIPEPRVEPRTELREVQHEEARTTLGPRSDVETFSELTVEEIGSNNMENENNGQKVEAIKEGEHRIGSKGSVVKD